MEEQPWLPAMGEPKIDIVWNCGECAEDFATGSIEVLLRVKELFPQRSG